MSLKNSGKLNLNNVKLIGVIPYVDGNGAAGGNICRN